MEILNVRKLRLGALSLAPRRERLRRHASDDERADAQQKAERQEQPPDAPDTPERIDHSLIRMLGIVEEGDALAVAKTESIDLNAFVKLDDIPPTIEFDGDQKAAGPPIWVS